MIFAQVAPDIIPLINLLVHGGSFAVLVYLMLWGLPKERREVQQSNSVAMQTLSADNKENMAFVSTDNKESIAGMLVVFSSQMAAEREMCMKFRQDDLVKHEKIMSVIDQRHTDIVQQIALQAKENRHEIKDLAQLLVNHDALVGKFMEDRATKKGPNLE